MRRTFRADRSGRTGGGRFNLNPFATASFFAPLTSSLTLTRGTGVATFTRATTATVVDFEGNVRLCKAGEARFTGARRVENLLNSTISIWNQLSGSTATDNTAIAPDGTLSASTIAFAATGSNGPYLVLGSVSMSSGVCSVWLRSSTARSVRFIWYATAQTISPNIPLTSTWTKYTYLGSGIIPPVFNFGFLNDSAGTAGSIEVWHPQLENVTGQSVQTASEYVSSTENSTGALGVKYFETDYAGNPIPAATLKGYLAEGVATNLCLQSNTFTSAPWIGSGSSVALAPSIVDPSGGANSYLLSISAGTAYFLQAGSIAANNTRSIWMKAGTAPYVWLSGTYANNSEACFDLLLGVVQLVNGVGTTASIKAYPNGWYRCSLTSPGADISCYLVISPKSFSGSLNGAVSTSACTCYIYGAQVELGSFATSYIPTTTVAVTRSADVLTYPSAGNVDSTMGSAFCESTLTSPCTNHRTLVGSQTLDRDVVMVTNIGNMVRHYDGTYWLGGQVANVAGTLNKHGISFGGISAVHALSGVVEGSTAFDGSFELPQISIGTSNSGLYVLNGNIKNVRLWTTQLTAAQLVQITTPTYSVLGTTFILGSSSLGA